MTWHEYCLFVLLGPSPNFARVKDNPKNMASRILRHLIAVIGSQLLNVAGNVLLMPVFLAHWSVGRYGEWLALSSTAAYFSTLDLGMNSAVGNKMLAAYAKGDMRDYSRSQHSALAFYLALAAGGSLLVGAAVLLFPISHWIGLKLTPPGVASLVIWLLAVQVLWAMPVGLLTNTYRSTGSPAKTQWVNNVKTVLLLVIPVTVVIAGGGMRALAAWQLMPLLVLAAFVFWNMRSKAPELIPGVSEARMSSVRELLKPSLMFAVIMVAMALVQQGSVLVVAKTLGGVAVAVFVTTRTLTNVVMQIVNVIKNVMWPNITILYAQGETARLRTMYRLLVLGSTALCIAFAAALWVKGPQVLRVWSHGKLVPDTLFLRMFLLYLVLQTPWIASSTLSVAINRHQRLAYCQLGAGVLGIGSAFALIHVLGLSAIPVGLIIGEAVGCYFFVLRDGCAILDEPLAPFLFRLWAGLAVVGGASLGAAFLAAGAARGPAAFQWLEVGTATFLTAFMLTWAVWLAPAERADLSRKARPMFASLLTALFKS